MPTSKPHYSDVGAPLVPVRHALLGLFGEPVAGGSNSIASLRPVTRALPISRWRELGAPSVILRAKIWHDPDNQIRSRFSHQGGVGIPSGAFVPVERRAYSTGEF